MSPDHLEPKDELLHTQKKNKKQSTHRSSRYLICSNPFFCPTFQRHDQENLQYFRGNALVSIPGVTVNVR